MDGMRCANCYAPMTLTPGGGWVCPSTGQKLWCPLPVETHLPRAAFVAALAEGRSPGRWVATPPRWWLDRAEARS